jgi:hypothetical protein
MRKKIQKSIFLFLTAFSSLFSFGQKSQQIKGNITDGKVAIEFANVILKMLWILLKLSPIL